MSKKKIVSWEAAENVNEVAIISDGPSWSWSGSWTTESAGGEGSLSLSIFILLFVYCIKDGIRGSFSPNFILTATLWSWFHCERMTGPWSLWKYPWQNGYLNLDILVPTLHPLSGTGSLWVKKTGLTSHRIPIVSFSVSHFYYPNDWNGNPVQSVVALNAALHHHFWPVWHICIPLLFTALASS